MHIKIGVAVVLLHKKAFLLEKNTKHDIILPDCTPPFMVEISTDNTEEEEESMSIIRDRGKIYKNILQHTSLLPLKLSKIHVHLICFRRLPGLHPCQVYVIQTLISRIRHMDIVV